MVNTKVKNIMKNKMVISGLLIILLIGGGLYKVKSSNAKGFDEMAMTSTTTIEKRDICSSVNVNGNVYVERSASLKPEGKAYVIKKHVSLGQVVKKGDLLMEMDDKSLRKSLDRKKLSLEIDKERLKQYQQEGNVEISNALKSAELDYKSAKEAYNAADKLFASGAVSKKAYQRDRDAFEKTELAFNKAKNDFKTNSNSTKIKIQELTIKSTQNEIDDLEEKISKKKIVSPFDGIVTQINFKENELYDESKVLIQVQDLESRVIKALVPESDINKLLVGQDVQVTANALKGKIIKGNVESTAPGTIKKEGKNIAYTEIIVKSKVFDEGLKEGFMTNLSIVTADKKSVLSVSTDALSTDIDGNITLTLQDGVGGQRKEVVKIGAESLMYTEILEGNVKEGDSVLVPNGTSGSGEAGEEEMDMGMGI